MKRKTIVALYIRVSTQEQAREGYSIEEQKERLEKYADAHGWIIYKVYSDPGFSGGSIERPGLKAMIRDISENKIDKVVVYKLDRLSRSQKDTLYLIEDIFLENNTDFVSMTENFDTSTPFGKAMIGILSVFAQLEREQIKERMALGREGRAKSGLWGGGANVPIGYRYANNVLTPDPFEAMIVRRIYSEYLSGKSKTAICTDLNKEGLRSSYGPFTKTTITQILHHGIYSGLIKYHDRYYESNYERIIDRETWLKIQELNRKNAEKNPYSSLGFNNRVSIITGLCYCKICGKKMKSVYNTPGRGYHPERGIQKFIVCPDKKKTGCTNRRYRMEEIEDIILTEIKKLRIDPDYLKAVRSKSENNNIAEEIQVLTDRIEGNDIKISRLMDLYSIGGVDLSQVKDKIENIGRESESLKRQIQDLKREQTESMTDEEIRECIDTLDLYIDNEDVERTRKIVTTLIKKIELSEDNIRIYWTF